MTYHIADEAAWRQALQLGFYDPPQRKQMGYVTCFAAVRDLAEEALFYSDRTTLTVLHIAEKRISHLYYERDPSRLKGPLPLNCITDVSVIGRGPDGQWDWTDLGSGRLG